MSGKVLFVAALLVCSCDSEEAPLSTVDTSAGSTLVFAAPQGIAVHPRWVVVASSAFERKGAEAHWNEGFVTLIDRRTRQVARLIPTTQRNPAEIALVGDAAYVLNTGTFTLNEAGLATVDSGGGIDVLDLSADTPPAGMARNIPLPQRQDDGRIGGYGSIAVSPDGRWAYVGSGTRGDVFQIDLDGPEVVRGPEDPIVVVPTPAGENGLTVVRRLGQSLAVLDFNRDTLCVSADWAGALADRRCQSVGVSAELLEGPIDLAADGDGRALVLMSIANSLYRVSTDTDPFVIEHDVASTGLANNRLAVLGDHAYVVNSSSNNLQRIDLRSGAWDLPFAVFPPHANPFALALSEEPAGPVAWVTLFGADQVAVVALDSGQILDRIGPRAALPASASSGAGGASPPCSDHTPAEVAIRNVVSVRYGPGAGHGQQQFPELVYGGPTGGGEGAGATRGVLSLGVGGEIVVDFGEHELVDGPGPDFIVFENPFLVGPFAPFSEPAIVGVSANGAKSGDFVDFPCALDQAEGDEDARRWPFAGCAGVRPVLAHVGQSCVDPADPQTAGGDAFDLAEIGVERARYIRLRDAGISHSGTDSRGFDLDAVVGVNFEPR